MDIRMYNCYFGDCFKINISREASLLVDYGIYHSCKTRQIREDRFDDIYKDIMDNEVDFLLSHYHEDHYNGAIHANQNHGYQFKNVYIPDIWGFDGCIEAINLELIRLILVGYKINKENTIFDFLKSICVSAGIINFVHRGSIIRNKYVALWPSQDYIKDQSSKILQETCKKLDIGEEDLSILYGFATRMREIVLQIRSRDFKNDDLIRYINDLEIEFYQFVENTRFRNKANKKACIPLKRFGNEISIVFQNVEDTTSENVLFTGDFGMTKKLWNIIENNTDGHPDCDMHKTYHVIKIPHHGTSSYYHSFVNHMSADSILMIPNDAVKGKGSWEICSKYSLNANSAQAKVICSASNSCEAKNCNYGKCTCTSHEIIQISKYYYKDIT